MQYRIVSTNPQSAMVYDVATGFEDEAVAQICANALNKNAEGADHNWRYSVRPEEVNEAHARFIAILKVKLKNTEGISDLIGIRRSDAERLVKEAQK